VSGPSKIALRRPELTAFFLEMEIFFPSRVVRDIPLGYSSNSFSRKLDVILSINIIWNENFNIIIV
jgi:hypothetical protein